MNRSARYTIHGPTTSAVGRSPLRGGGVPATLIPLKAQADLPERPQLVSCRVLDVVGNGAKVICENPLPSDRLWLSFVAARRTMVDAEIVWSDFASAGPAEIVYGVSFCRLLGESEFGRLIDTLTIEDDCEELFAPTARERELSLFTLFRGHAPHGARSSSAAVSR